jgi:hypothetical protein
MHCNSTLRSDEKVCYSCESKVPERNASTKNVHDHFRTALNALVIILAVMTIGSLLTDMFPSFTKCVSLLAILILVKKSADNMSDIRKDS